jgi:ribosomal-protein-alanine N-acetyltransferase
MILAPLTPEDEKTIHFWPRYPAEVEALDYALRDNGWLALFPPGPNNLSGKLVGFSILTRTSPQKAEFYVAVHPEDIGKGLGKTITRMVIQEGFERLKLHKIFLKVRPWHERAIRLYEGQGFRRIGTEDSEINGKLEHFLIMELDSTTALTAL